MLDSNSSVKASYNRVYQFSLEGYYKDLRNQVDYEDGANTLLNEDVEAELVFGKGYAWGVEALFRKTQGKFTGWLGYTYAKSKRKFEHINNGDWYSARQDHTHDLSVVGVYQLSKKLNMSLSWVYNTGSAVTFPSGKYEVDGAIVNLHSERNGYRMPDYHRLDIGLTWILKDTERYIQIKSRLSFVFVFLARPQKNILTPLPRRFQIYDMFPSMVAV